MKTLLLSLIVVSIVGCAGFKASDIQSLVDSLAKDQAGVCVSTKAAVVLPAGSQGWIYAGRLNSANSSLTVSGDNCTVTTGAR